MKMPKLVWEESEQNDKQKKMTYGIILIVSGALVYFIPFFVAVACIIGGLFFIANADKNKQEAKQ